MSSKVALVWPGLIELSNSANEKLAAPAAERVKSAASRSDGLVVDTTSRDSKTGWARSRVLITKMSTLKSEAKHGNMARAIGGV